MVYYTSKEAADYLGISLSTLFRVEKKGLIEPVMTPGGHRRFSQQMLDDYLSSSRQFKSKLNPSQSKTSQEKIVVSPSSRQPEVKAEAGPSDNDEQSVYNASSLIEASQEDKEGSADSYTYARPISSANVIDLSQAPEPQPKLSQHLIDLSTPPTS